MDDTSERKGVAENTVHENIENKNEVSLKQPVVFLLSAVAETGLVSLPSLLTAVLLQANSRMSTDQASYVLPMNFEEVATGVLKILNNLAILDITLLQSMLIKTKKQSKSWAEEVLPGGTYKRQQNENQRDNRGSKTCDEWALKHSLPASEASSTFMLHRRFPSTFLDKAEEFFSQPRSPQYNQTKAPIT
ncbi:hypothetical protein J5N97_015816 [Dioscorea zingiberensis]|uniref:Uncharacterized protein n=1 Tax=Dioscorea zingiberensis TaxID=325984 RepID=A0A9D5CI91_9LILI|nr:hypothetical protein J5N97_015816 [Dioscorea zingiberensis]